MKRMTIDWRECAVAYIRSHVDANKIPGEWNWSCTVEKISDTTCKIALANRAPNPKELAELIETLEGEGFEVAIWDRHKEGRPSRTFTLHSKTAQKTGD
jgi:hypothetical protein